MINRIMEAIGTVLNAEFGDGYKIYREEAGQEFQGPCFFTACTNSSNKQFSEKRYLRENQFCIRYFPEIGGKEREECYGAAERLFSCLEWLTVDGDFVMGTRMRCEMTDGVLLFFVNYDVYVYKMSETVPAMEEISSETAVKG